MTTSALTDEQIDHLITIRNVFTDRRDEMIDFGAVEHVDVLLSSVPPGQRNDVDLLLGRSCAALPKRPGYFVNPAAQMWGWMGDDTITTVQIAELEARSEETDGNREER